MDSILTYKDYLNEFWVLWANSNYSGTLIIGTQLITIK